MSVTNVGLASIPATNDASQSAGEPSVGTSAPDQTVLVAWLIGTGHEVQELFRVPLVDDLAPETAWVVKTPIAAFADALPGTVALRLIVAGDPGRLDGSIPGVFAIDWTTSIPAVQSGDASNSSPTDAPPVLSIQPVTPIDLSTPAGGSTNVAASGPGAEGTTLTATVNPGASTLDVTLIEPPDASAARARPTALDGFLVVAAAVPRPSVLTRAVPLIGVETSSVSSAAALSAAPDAEGTSTVSVSLPAAATEDARPVYLVTVQIQDLPGAVAQPLVPMTLWLVAPPPPPPTIQPSLVPPRAVAPPPDSGGPG